ncbi:branched-chain amino acid ABC transporter permease [Terasakiella sp. A23]|uniref:branched-chain amino acid ABC transporter permease n=1 Tax=Terasakiella sp. FCG-A23 TaxID=3080561 RepID=UPI002952A2DE|nr:branched-chain amino acid ABC transporter permease [Terasakiella sp. A23]MDV7341228.1 branched-chain amino acid ABC transporter permease [Terasakiella sp. A23]
MEQKYSYMMLIAALAVMALGLILPYWFSFLVTVALAKGLVVLGLLILMRTGLVSFGQGLYYCAGAYAVGAFSNYFETDNVVILLLVAIVAGVVISSLVGLLLCRYRDIFFAMFSMAFSMILYGVLVKSADLGSSDGFNVTAPALFGWAPQVTGGGILPYWTAIILVCLAGYIIWKYLQSPMGMAGEAIRENEIRVEYLGVSVQKMIYFKYIFAAVLASLGGAIVAMSVGHIDPEMAYWTTSGEFVFIALLGGIGHVAAPLLGAIIFELMRTFAFQLSPYTWQMVLGIALLAIIIFLPKGLWSLKSKIVKGEQA